MNKKYYILPALFCFVVLLTCISQCRKNRESGSPAIRKQERTSLIKGRPDTTTILKRLKGHASLRKVLKPDSTTEYTGSISDSTGSVSIIARLNSDSSLINLEYTGAIAEKLITCTDTLLHNTLEVQEITSPWYDSFAVGLITGGALLIIYLIIHSCP